jgi:expansin (peptidoglycan-binding protein)
MGTFPRHCVYTWQSTHVLHSVAGACGTVHSDNDLIAAIDVDRYGNTGVQSSLCGKQVKITNPANKKSVTVTIADACPTCENSNSIDLSVGAFTQIATEAQGEVAIDWEFV